MKVPRHFCNALVALAILFALTGCREGDVVDEAKAAGKTVADFPASSVDFFPGMDGKVELTPEEVEGRNTWMLWTGGNEAFWDHLARNGYGLVEFLKTIDSRRRATRFQTGGLMNEPGFRAATEPDEFGLYLDQPTDAIGPVPDPAVYGRSTGVIGFRIFSNPNFDETARLNWDADRFYNDQKYAQNPKLVRPYRVGMTCAVCHVSFHPLHPPVDRENPQWTELSSTLGNQYFETIGVFGTDLKPDDFLYHVLRSAPPGTVDTSVIATDNNNNPNIINSIFNVEARLSVAQPEKIAGGALKLEGGGETRRVPHVLVDGADSVGLQPALNRVFVNVGTFGEEWVRCHNPILGGRRQKQFSIENAQKNSVYWQATERNSVNLAKFLIKAGRPMPLKDAPGGAQLLSADAAILDRGKIVFAENCVACHSSKRPPESLAGAPENYEAWARSPEFLGWAREAVMKPDFLENNFLSTDARYPVTLLKTNASRALQDNAMPGHIWAEFSSVNYKQTPSPGAIEVLNPFSSQTEKFSIPSGGPGFYRVPTLVSLWNSAPLLHNNMLGDYSSDPSVEARVKSFDDAITKMFWSDRRPGVASIARTSDRSWLKISAVYLPVAVEGILGASARPFLNSPWLLPVLVSVAGIVVALLARRLRRKFSRRIVIMVACLVVILGVGLFPACYFAAGRLGDLKMGPFPKGMPLNMLASLNPDASQTKLVPALVKMALALRTIEKENLSDEAALALLNEKVGPALFAVSKSPDWVQDRGHYFAEHLSDADKNALIAFLKTL